MLKIVYRVCCGMDVHKSFVVACIASTNEQGVTSYKTKRFSYFTGDLHRCATWLAENGCKDVCMESTGKYWIPIYNILESTCHIVLAHPKYVKAIRGKKTDKKDAKWIADIFKHDLISGSFIPPSDIRQLRDLVRYYWKLTSFTTGEKNRAQNCLNIKLDDVFSDVFGKAATAITTRLLESNEPFDVVPYLNKRIKTPAEKIQAAVIKTFSAIGIISEIDIDMSVFPTSKHLCSWAGLTPQNNESAGKKKTTRISRGGAYIKPLLVQCALNAITRQTLPRSPQSLSHTKKAPEAQKSDHCHCKNASYGYLQHAQEERTVQP